MVYRDIPFTIRTGIQRNRWTVVVHLLNGQLVSVKTEHCSHRPVTVKHNERECADDATIRQR